MADVFKIESWAQPLHDSLCKFLATVRDPKIQGVFGTFMYNFQSCHSLPYVIAEVFSSGWGLGKADARARREILGHDRELPDGTPPGPFIPMTPELEELEKQIAARRTEIHHDASTMFVIPIAEGGFFKHLLPQLSLRLRNDMTMMFSMQVVSAWAAFETLAGDLWVASVNTHSDVLAELAGTESRIKRKSLGHKPESPGGTQTAKRRKDITLKQLKAVSGNTYNLSGRMGSLLRPTRQWGLPRVNASKSS